MKKWMGKWMDHGWMNERVGQQKEGGKKEWINRLLSGL